MQIPEFKDVFKAHERIADFVHKTPVITSKSINEIAGCEIFFKCENFQKVGAFKFRGATNAVLNLKENSSIKKVATHSSGNHAQALALAAEMNGMEAHIVMPSNSPIVKKNAVAGYGASIYYCEPTLQAREDTLEEVIRDTGSELVHPYNNSYVIAGQGTAALELLDIISNPDFMIAPVGGGGLLSGTSISTRKLSPHTQIIAAEPEGADDAMRSFKTGNIVPSVNPDTVCDGLLTSLGDLNFAIIQKNINDILTAPDDLIISSMKLIWERMKIIVEPSSAVALAIVLKYPGLFKGKKVAIILSGGNVDLEKLPWDNKCKIKKVSQLPGKPAWRLV